MHKILKSRGSDPKAYIMKNEYSSDLKEATKKYAIDFQLVPPNMHRQNAAERSILTLQKLSYFRILHHRPEFIYQKMGLSTFSMFNHIEFTTQCQIQPRSLNIRLPIWFIEF